jgi:hypothetical protein
MAHVFADGLVGDRYFVDRYFAHGDQLREVFVRGLFVHCFPVHGLFTHGFLVHSRLRNCFFLHRFYTHRLFLRGFFVHGLFTNGFFMHGRSRVGEFRGGLRQFTVLCRWRGRCRRRNVRSRLKSLRRDHVVALGGQ